MFVVKVNLSFADFPVKLERKLNLLKSVPGTIPCCSKYPNDVKLDNFSEPDVKLRL